MRGIKKAIEEWHSVDDDELEWFYRAISISMLIWMIAETIRTLA